MSASYSAWLFETLKLSLRTCSKVILSGPSRMIPAPLPFTWMDCQPKRSTSLGRLCRFQWILLEIQPWIVSSWGCVVCTECRILTIQQTKLPSFMWVHAFSKPTWWGSLSVEAMLSKIILMIPKTQVKNQESSKFQESKSCSIKIQDSSKESREDSIKISIKRVFQNIE